MKQLLQEILEGSVEEKIAAAEAIWNSIDEESFSVTDEETAILKERYNAYQQKPGDTIDWESAYQNLPL